MYQEKMIEDVVRKVLENITGSSEASTEKLNPDKDYPLANKRPELVKTPTGKNLKEISLDKVLNGDIAASDLRISPETLRMQSEIAKGVGRNQFANNLLRAAELTLVPDQRILEIYNALRPYRSTKRDLLEIAEELETKFNAKINAAYIREAAEVYDRRNRLRSE